MIPEQENNIFSSVGDVALLLSLNSLHGMCRIRECNISKVPKSFRIQKAVALSNLMIT